LHIDLEAPRVAVSASRVACDILATDGLPARNKAHQNSRQSRESRAINGVEVENVRLTLFPVTRRARTKAMGAPFKSTTFYAIVTTLIEVTGPVFRVATRSRALHVRRGH